MLHRGIILVGLIIAFGFVCTGANQTIGIALPDTFNTEIPDHLINYSAQLINNGQLDDAKKLIDWGISQSTVTENAYLNANLNYYLADYYYYKEEYDSAHNLYSNVLPMFEEQHDTLMLAKTLNSLGIIHSLELDNEKTLMFYLQEAELLNSVTNHTHQLNVEKLVLLTNIINLYSDASEYEKVVDRSKDAIDLAHELKDTLRLGSILNTLALAQKNLGQIDQSLRTFKEAGDLFKSTNDDFRISFILNNIGGLYEMNDRDLDSAYYYYQLSLEGFELNNYQYGISMALLGVASVQSKKGSYSIASANYQRAIEISKKFNFNVVLTTALNGLSQLEYDRANYKKAYDYLELYNSINDSLFSIEKHKQFAELEAKYNIVQKENEINLLKNEKLSQQLKLGKANLQRFIGFTLVIFLLIAFYVFKIYYNQKRRDNKLLVEKNKQIEEQNERLQSMNKHIKTINKHLHLSKQELTLANISKNKFFSILAHDLRNPLHTILGQSFLLSKTYDKLSSEERKKGAHDVYAACEQVNRLLDNLLEWSQTQSNGIEFKPEKLLLKDIIFNVFSLLQINAEQKSLVLNNLSDPDIEISADRQMLETIIRNTINNGIKFTPDGGKIHLSTEISNDRLRITIEDNGIGIEKPNLKKLFKIHSNFKTKGTNNEYGTGLGLVICKEFVTYHKGEIWVESTFGKGTKVFVELPLAQKN